MKLICIFLSFFLFISPAFASQDSKEDKCDPHLSAYGGYGYLVENGPKAPYLTLLAEAISKANPSSRLVKEAKSLLSLPKDFYKDDTHFSKDPRFLLKRRERIAELIEILK